MWDFQNIFQKKMIIYILKFNNKKKFKLKKKILIFKLIKK